MRVAVSTIALSVWERKELSGSASVAGSNTVANAGKGKRMKPLAMERHFAWDATTVWTKKMIIYKLVPVWYPDPLLCPPVNCSFLFQDTFLITGARKLCGRIFM